MTTRCAYLGGTTSRKNKAKVAIEVGWRLFETGLRVAVALGEDGDLENSTYQNSGWTERKAEFWDRSLIEEPTRPLWQSKQLTRSSAKKRNNRETPKNPPPQPHRPLWPGPETTRAG
jgi:hypothetical protein